MRNIAHFAMRGPFSAFALAAITCFFPLTFWLGNAIVALVTLRKGYSKGLITAAAALLGATLWYQVSGETTSILAVGSVFIAALSLRSNNNWQQLLLIVVVLGALNQLVLIEFSSDYLQKMTDFIKEIIQQSQMSLENKEAILATFGPESLAAYSSQVIAYSSIASIALGRWWQSVLYNPGGFGTEFKSLRLNPPLAAILLSCIAITVYLDKLAWLGLLSLPLLITGIALVHAYISHFRLGNHWLVMFYMLLILGGGIKLGLVLLATIDSSLDFRKRWPKQPS